MNLSSGFKISRTNFEKFNETHMDIDFRGSGIVAEIEDFPCDRNDSVHQLVSTFSREYTMKIGFSTFLKF